MRSAPSLLYALFLCTAACSEGSSGGKPAGPAYPACNDQVDVVYSSADTPFPPPPPNGLLAVGDTFYYLTAGDSDATVNLQSIVPGGQPTTIAVVLGPVTGPLWADGTSIHWVTIAEIGTLPLAGGMPSELPSTIGYDGPFTSDAASVYALGPSQDGHVSVWRQPLSGGQVTTITTTISGLGSPALYDGGDHLIVVDEAPPGVYLIPKDGSGVTHFSAPSSVFKIWHPASPTSFYANSPDGLLETYTLGGAVTPLWAPDSAPLVTTNLAIGTDGTVFFSGELERAPYFVGTAFGVVTPGHLATLTQCVSATSGTFVNAVVAGAAGAYAMTSAPNSKAWAIIRLPK